MKNYLLIATLILAYPSKAQLPNGSIAPDFTLMDIVDSNTHHLYDYLNDGKTVIIEIFAAHCPSCWGYHQTHRLKDLYNTYGPNGTEELMVLALEYDPNNFYDHFIGIGDPWNTAGNWLEGTPYPIFQVEGADRQIFTDYQVSFYPVLFKVCPDKKTELLSTSMDVAQLYSEVQECEPLSVDEQVLSGKVYVDNTSKQLVIENFAEVQSLEIVNLQGQIEQSVRQLNSETISLLELESGVYLFRIATDKGMRIERFWVN